MIKRVLIANRGEIAIRLARGARELGISPVGIASEADRHALHRRAMDESLIIGPAQSALSYLNIPLVVEAAKQLNADAVHPGYGFLSERAEFAEAVIKAGLTFIGPEPAALHMAGDKRLARNLAHELLIPTLEGYDGDDQNPERLLNEAKKIGFPVLIKASNGGGGRGQRVVQNEAEFLEQLEASKREALSAFGDDSVLLERHLENPRHIEFQIIADHFGKIVHLGERDCSLQRRRQKVIEEAPAPNLPAPLRAAMGDAAIRLARAANYRNAGTVEFLIDAQGNFFFLEINARLQVEHPVTELVTGTDIVQLQYRIASGEELPLNLGTSAPHGWAFEARICAEDPEHDLLPSSGTIHTWITPTIPGIRVDSGFEAGSVVPMDYDSLLAKLIVWDTTREAALKKLELALSEMHIGGVATNVSLLRDIAADPHVREAHFSTTFIDKTRLSSSTDSPKPDVKISALVLGLAAALNLGIDWRLNTVGEYLMLQIGTTHVVYRANNKGNSWQLEKQNAFYEALHGTPCPSDIPEALTIWIDSSPALHGRSHLNIDYATSLSDTPQATSSGLAFERRDGITIIPDGTTHPIPIALHAPLDARTLAQRAVAGPAGVMRVDTRIVAPMPGRIVRILVQQGDAVEDRQLLAVLEAMKMEHRIEATGTGIVKTVFCKEADVIPLGTAILELSPPPKAASAASPQI